MATRGRDFERPARDLLATDVGHVGACGGKEGRRRRGLGARRLPLQGLDQLAEVSDGDDLAVASYHRGLGRVFPGHE